MEDHERITATEGRSVDQHHSSEEVGVAVNH